jgi:hypothetical protein
MAIGKRVSTMSLSAVTMPLQSFVAKTEAVVVTVNVTHQQLRMWRAGLLLFLVEPIRKIVEWVNSW